MSSCNCGWLVITGSRSVSPFGGSPGVGSAGRTSENSWWPFDCWWVDRVRWCKWDAVHQSTFGSSDPQQELVETETHRWHHQQVKTLTCSEQHLCFGNNVKIVLTPVLAFKGAPLTDAEEKQGLHAQELFLSDLQQQELLGNVSHPYAVLVHGGDVHPMSCRLGKKKVRNVK